MLGSLAGLVLAFLDAHGRGWYLLLSMAFATEVWSSFAPSRNALEKRRASLRWEGLWVKAFRPLARVLDKEEAWILSFCAWNNLRVQAAFKVNRARKALILLPHCIQAADCKAEIIKDLGNCFRCGRCPAGDVLTERLLNRWDCRISNRSHKAYREAREFKPDLILAVSCSDRLLKGLLKLPEIPCYVIPLQLPYGMCVDTTFSVVHLQRAMDFLVEPKAAAENVAPLKLQTGA